MAQCNLLFDCPSYIILWLYYPIEIMANKRNELRSISNHSEKIRNGHSFNHYYLLYNYNNKSIRHSVTSITKQPEIFRSL